VKSVTCVREWCQLSGSFYSPIPRVLSAWLHLHENSSTKCYILQCIVHMGLMGARMGHGTKRIQLSLAIRDLDLCELWNILNYNTAHVSFSGSVAAAVFNKSMSSGDYADNSEKLMDRRLDVKYAVCIGNLNWLTHRRANSSKAWPFIIHFQFCLTRSILDWYFVSD
jgi:hypothetical protein